MICTSLGIRVQVYVSACFPASCKSTKGNPKAGFDQDKVGFGQDKAGFGQDKAGFGQDTAGFDQDTAE